MKKTLLCVAACWLLGVGGPAHAEGEGYKQHPCYQRGNCSPVDFGWETLSGTQCWTGSVEKKKRWVTCDRHTPNIGAYEIGEKPIFVAPKNGRWEITYDTKARGAVRVK